MMVVTNKISCEQCSRIMDSGVSECPFCGAPMRTIDISDTLLERPRLDMSPLMESSGRLMIDLTGYQMALYVEDASIPLIVDLSNRVTLGRHSSRDSKVSPTVSLNSYSAFNHGISRVHATMYYDAERATAVIIDEYSTNGTWVNGQRIAPMVPTPVKSGDELRLSRLRILLIGPSSQTAAKQRNSASQQID